MGESGPGYVATAPGETVEPVGILPQGTVVDTPRAKIVDGSGHTSNVAALVTAGGSDENHDVISGQLVSDHTTGAVVNASSGTVLWRAAGWGLGQFSNDGRYVLGVQPADGSPDTYAVFDAATGRRITTFSLGSIAPRFVGSPAWDINDTLLAAVTANRTSAIVRIDLDGRVTRATPVVDVSGQHLGYRLATRP
jgi:hypothetical protein